MLNSITFIHLEDYMFHDIRVNIINSMNLSRSLINLFCSSINHTSVKLMKMTDWFSNLISFKAMTWIQSSKLHVRRWNAFFVYYYIYSSSRYIRRYHLYLSNCLALLIVNRKSYRSILCFVINHASSSLMWWINSMRSFWSCFSISSWLHMFKFCKNVFFIFLVWDEICKSELSHSNKAAKYLFVKEIIFCKILKLLLSWIVESLNILVSSKIADKYLIWLKILNVHVMLINEL